VVGYLDPGGEVLTMNTEGAVVSTVEAGFDPEIAVSPDGSRLYIASSSTTASELVIIDAATHEEIAAVPLNDRTGNTLPPALSSLAVSTDGRHVYALEMETDLPNSEAAAPVDHNTVAVLDAMTGAPVGEVEIPGCYAAQMLPFDGGVDVVCPGLALVYTVTTADGVASARHISLSHDVAGATRLPLSGDLLVVSLTGEATRLAGGTYETVSSRQLDIGEREVVLGGVVASRDDSRVLAGVAPPAPRSATGMTHLAVIDVSELRVTAVNRLDHPLWSLTASPSGTVYGVDRDGGTVWVVDVSSGQPSSSFEVPTTPAYLVATD